MKIILTPDILDQNNRCNMKLNLKMLKKKNVISSQIFIKMQDTVCNNMVFKVCHKNN